MNPLDLLEKLHDMELKSALDRKDCEYLERDNKRLINEWLKLKEKEIKDDNKPRHGNME